MKLKVLYEMRNEVILNKLRDVVNGVGEISFEELLAKEKDSTFGEAIYKGTS